MCPRGKTSHCLNWFRIPFKTPVKLKTANSHSDNRPAFNSASYWSAWHTSTALRAAAATLDLHTLRIAVNVIGRACEGLQSQASTNQVTNPTTIKSFAYFNDGIAGGSTLPSTSSSPVTTITTATRRTATLLTTKEWKLQRYPKSDSQL